MISILLICVVVGLAASEPIFYDCGVASSEKEIIINEHNKYRLQIARGELKGQPRGINLKRMAWDEKLAVEAQKVAATGKFEHHIVADDRFPAVGQNLFMWWSTAASAGSKWASGIKSWWKEHENFVYGAATQNGVTGHYTQVVWADTYLVGCGYCYFYDEVAGYRKLYVCNYGPAGNWRGQNPYKTGSSGCENLC